MRGRARSTLHCQECAYHVKPRDRNAKHRCWKDGRRWIHRDRARTSPDWCPLGHFIPGRRYPSFTPGPDPRTD